MPARNSLPPYPNGWFAVGFSDELPRGGLLARPFMGQDVVVYRTQSGQACAVDAYCAHLGAHFGYGGSVEGEWLRCPFHGFCYDTHGNCVKTGYGTKPPPTAKLRVWHLRETNGVLLLYHDCANAAPTWDIPALDLDGWTRAIYRKFTLLDHPQETTENSVDIGHFAFVHKYRNTRMLREAVTDGAYLSTAYAAQRAAPGLARLFPNVWLDFQFETQIHGLGYSLVNVTVPGARVEARLWVLPTPIDDERIQLYLATRIKIAESSKIHPLLAPLPKRALHALINRVMLNSLANDAQQDFVIWQNKKYVQPPALAEGDGPIGKYRQWAKQFYGDVNPEVRSPAEG